MGCYRVPSPTPSIESDAPIPEAPQEVSPGAENIKAHWMIFVGNVSVSSFPRRAPNADSRGKLHPKVTETELYDLFGGRDRSRNVIIRTTRGCGVIPIPEEDVGPRDRCYASIEVKGLNRTKEIMDKYRKNPPKLYGLPLTLGHSPADMPEFLEILERAKGSVPEETEYVNVIRSLARLFAEDRPRCTEKSIPRRRLTIQKTLEDIEAEEQPRSLAGPSRSSAKPKPRYNPLRREELYRRAYPPAHL